MYRKLWLILVFLLLTWAAFGQDKPRFKVKVVAPKPADITLDVFPKVSLTGRKTFRVRTTIEPDDRNAIYSLSADCGYDAYASQRKVEAITDTRYIDITVSEPCVFVACLYRVENGKVGEPICRPTTVSTPE